MECRRQALDWFVRSGAEVVNDDFDPELVTDLGIAEVSVGERSIFLGPRTNPDPSAMYGVEVAALLYEDKPFDGEVIASELDQYDAPMNDRHQLEILVNDETGYRSIWFALDLDISELTDEVLERLIPEFVKELDRIAPLLA